jgi:hypothetical protein
MAHPYDDRSRGEYRGERGFDRGGRNFFERAGEEVRSWFGGDDRGRRHPDEHEYMRERMGSERGWTPGERREGSERWQTEPDRWRSDEDRWRSDRGGEYGRGDYDRWAGGTRGWDEPRYGSSYGTSERWGRQDAWGPSRPAGKSDDWRYRSSNESRGVYEDDSGRVHTFSHWPDANYAGRGPKGYRRSDERIHEDICDRLTDDWRIDASEMEIAVQNGEVMLSGMVRSREDKRRAEDMVENIPGVRDVHNNLRVGRVDEMSGTRGGVATGSAPGTTSSSTQTTPRR